MPNYNFTWLLCNELFGPVVGTIDVMTGGSHNKAAKKLAQLVDKVLTDSGFIWSKEAVGGMMLDENSVILDPGMKHNLKLITHENFHIQMYKKRGCSSEHSLVLEESFANAYTSIRLDHTLMQEKAIMDSEKCRKGFNHRLKCRIKKLEDIVQNNPMPKQFSEYPSILHNLQYEAYVDLGIKLFRQYKIRKTIQELAVAETIISQTSDHRDGVNHLNSKLQKDKQIENILDIKSIYADIYMFLYINTSNFCFNVYGMKADSGFYNGLVESALKILVPALQHEESLKVLPQSYSKLFKKE